MVRRGKAISGVLGNGDRLWVGCDDNVSVGNREGAAGVDAADTLWNIQNQCNSQCSIEVIPICGNS
jgi:hypothetical protein